MKRKAIIESLRHRHKDADYNRRHLSTSEARFIEEGKFQAYSVALRMLGESVPIGRGEARSAVREVSTRIRDMALRLERFTEENPHAPSIEIDDETNTATISPPPNNTPAMIRLHNGARHVASAAFDGNLGVNIARIADTVTVTGYKLYNGAGDCIQEGAFDPVHLVPQGPAIPLDALTIGYDDDDGDDDDSYGDLWDHPDSDDDAPDDEPAYDKDGPYLGVDKYDDCSGPNPWICGKSVISSALDPLKPPTPTTPQPAKDASDTINGFSSWRFRTPSIETRKLIDLALKSAKPFLVALKEIRLANATPPTNTPDNDNT